MDFRMKDAIKGWLKDAGMLYVLVSLLVVLGFAFKNAPGLLSCNPSFGRNATTAIPPGYYGRSH